MQQLLNSLLALWLIAGYAYGDQCPEFAAATHRTAVGMATEIATANGADRQRAYERYIALFHPQARVYGLVEDRPATMEDVRLHYRAVFFELQNGTLIEDARVVAGDMGAHRYHSMLTLDGTFDGVVARDKPVLLRGQTFFRFDGAGRIAERWSNHDHAFRMRQLLGERGEREGAALAKVLNGPGLGEQDVDGALQRFASVFSRGDAPELRDDSLFAMFHPEARVHGLACEPVGLGALQNHYRALWEAFPDLHMDFVGKPMSAWSMGAFKWRALGSQRKPYAGRAATHRTVVNYSGELIARFDASAKIVELWLNEAPLSFFPAAEPVAP